MTEDGTSMNHLLGTRVNVSH